MILKLLLIIMLVIPIGYLAFVLLDNLLDQVIKYKKSGDADDSKRK